VFNLLGPLANPARARTQVIGAPSSDFARTMAEALAELGTGHSFVAHGRDGLDEISTVGWTDVYEVWTGRVEKQMWAPEDFGVPRASLEALAGGGAAENAAITVDILRGAKNPRRDIVLVNAAAGLMAAGLADSACTAMLRAAESIDSGRALGVLENLQKKFPLA
jgi:anthranilate phosphoribosyltransferase